MHLKFYEIITTIQEVQSAKDVVVTFGESYILQCKSKLEESLGSFPITVPENRTVNAKGWILPTLIRRTFLTPIRDRARLNNPTIAVGLTIDEVLNILKPTHSQA